MNDRDNSLPPHIAALVQNYEGANVTTEDVAMLYRFCRLAPHLGIEMENIVRAWFDHRSEALITRQSITNYLRGTMPQADVWTDLMRTLAAVRKHHGKEVLVPPGVDWQVGPAQP